MTSPWAELGIVATADARVIRKAYAIRVKQTRPEDDPAGFARLRAAYEAALALAPRLGPAVTATPLIPPSPPPAMSPEHPTVDSDSPSESMKPDTVGEPIEDDQAAEEEDHRPEAMIAPEAEAAIRAIAGALDRREGEIAAGLLLSASDHHLLPLRAEFALKDRLAAVLLADRSMPTENLLSIARRFGWYDPKDIIHQRRNSAEGRLRARLESELYASAASQPASVKPRPPKPASNFRSIAFALFILVTIGRAIAAWSGDTHNGMQPPAEFGKPAVSLPVLGSACALDPAGHLLRDPSPTLAYAYRQAKPIVGWQHDLAEKAADGWASDQNKLGLAYYNGLELPRDDTLAVWWFRLAALQADHDGLRNLAEMCRQGLGTPKDVVGARQLFLQAAERNDSTAQARLAGMLLFAEGGPADVQGSFSWARRSALGNNPEGMTLLSQLYKRSDIAGKDLKKSAAWLRAAATAGYSYALYLSGLTALNDDQPDVAAAYRWLKLAYRRLPDGQEREDTARRLAEAPINLLAPEIRGQIDRELESWQPAPASAPAIDAQ
jgi:TPR repeat protein